MKRWRLLIVVCAVVIIAYWWYDHWREHRFDKEIVAAARRYQLEPALVKAVIWRESRFNPEARGRAGELGLMQIRETAALEWSETEHLTNFEHAACLDPVTNTLAGTWYLKKVLKRYNRTDNPLPYALADYNAGRGNVLKWKVGRASTNSAAFIESMQFPSTKAYVLAILNRYEHYKPLIKDGR